MLDRLSLQAYMEERTSQSSSWTSPIGRTRGIARSSSPPSDHAKLISSMPRSTAVRKGSQEPQMKAREASKAPMRIQPSSDKQPSVVARVKSRPPLKCLLTKSKLANQPISQTIASPSSTITLLHKLQAQATSVEKDTKLRSKSPANHPVRRKSNLRHVDSDVKSESINIKTEVASVSSDVNIEQRRSSNEKEREIAISRVSKDSLTDGERAIYEEEIKKGLSALKQKIPAANSGEGRSNGSSVNVITLAGKNNGASMVIGYDDELGEDSGGGGGGSSNGETVFAASINNNVQSINNSVIEQSSCSVRHPGVHLKISNRSSENLASDEAMKPQNAEPRTFAPLRGQMTSQEPRIRRRCLRALFMESSESDIENPQKPRRHGCRFSCEEKRKMEKGTSRG